MSKSLQLARRLFWGSFISLPYLFFVSFVGLVAMIGLLFQEFGRSALDSLTRNSLLVVTGLLVLSSLFAVDRGEALLQLANFLPYFLLFAVLPYVLRGVEALERLAIAIVIATIPINLLALVEYILRSPLIPRTLRRTPIIHWLRNRPHTGRAMVMFTHPNSLANYLVLVLGLGLGLIGWQVIRQRSGRWGVESGGAGNEDQNAILEHSSASIHPLIHRLSPFAFSLLIYSATFLNLVGIFCSGSRNGLVVAVSQVALFSLLVKANWRVLVAGLVGVGALMAGVAGWGIGGRSLDLQAWTNDPRWRVWQIALDLIRERPWLGWGLGNYKFQFPQRLLANYPECLAERQLKVIPVECADVGHPHNFWLLLGSEAGLPVLVLLTALVGYICFRGVRLFLSRQLPPAHNAILLAYLLSFWGCIACAMFDVTLYDARLNATSWVVLSGIYVVGVLGSLDGSLDSSKLRQRYQDAIEQ